MGERYFQERYDSNTWTGEIRYIEQYILNYQFDFVSEPVTDRALQIKGVDYIVRSNGFVKANGNQDIYVDVKHDHSLSKGDFVYELTDRFGHSWTQQDNHITDFILWIKHSEGIGYFISKQTLVDFSKTDIFKYRVEHNTGEGAVSKFFRLESEIPYIAYVPFNIDKRVPMINPMSDERKYANYEKVDLSQLDI